MRRTRERPYAVILDSIATGQVLNAAEKAGVRAIAAKNFSSTETGIELMSF